MSFSKPIFNFHRNIYWTGLSGNPNAIHMLEQNLDVINWFWLSENPNAIHLLEKNLDRVVWWSLSKNPNVIHILKKYLNLSTYMFISGLLKNMSINKVWECICFI